MWTSHIQFPIQACFHFSMSMEFLISYSHVFIEVKVSIVISRTKQPWSYSICPPLIFDNPSTLSMWRHLSAALETKYLDSLHFPTQSWLRKESMQWPCQQSVLHRKMLRSKTSPKFRCFSSLFCSEFLLWKKELIKEVNYTIFLE